MKKVSIFAAIILILTLALSTIQVYASSGAAAAADRGNPNPNSAGHNDRKATQQAEKDQRMANRDAEKAQRMEDKLIGKKEHFRGEVTAVDAASLTIKLASGEELVFTLNNQTIFKIPTLGPGATWEQLNVGVTVMVQAVMPKETSTETPVATEEVVASGTPVVSGLTAIKVLVVPGKPARIHRVGEVTVYEAGKSITIKAKDGQEYTFVVTDATKILPAERADQLVVGAFVTIISPRDVTGGPLTAQGIVVHDKSDTDGGETVTETPTP